MKLKWIVAGVIAVGVVSLPWWGGCDINAKLCTGWCSVRYFNADIKAAGCRARCRTDQLACVAREGTRGLDNFIEGFKD